MSKRRKLHRLHALLLEHQRLLLRRAKRVRVRRQFGKFFLLNQQQLPVGRQRWWRGRMSERGELYRLKPLLLGEQFRHLLQWSE
jgi:hypothetical protein